jgi:hypothetical protein
VTQNRYAAPRADFSLPKKIKRPIPVYLITIWCTLQIVGLGIFITDSWQDIRQIVYSGVESPAAFVAGLIFPALFFVSGLLLFFMRKAATYAFLAYLSWGLLKIILNGRSSPGPIDLTVTIAITLYCLWLHRRGKLG